MGRIHQPEKGVRFVEANGLRFATLEWGEGPLVLLCHGFPDTPHTWDEVGPELARAGYRVVAPFLRGYAPTAMPERDTDSRALGEDVIALVRALGADKARLVGHDWGAEAVYAATALAPERVERLVAVAVPNRAAITFTPRLIWALRHFFALSFPGGEARFAANDYAMVDVFCRRWSPTWKFTREDLEPVKNALAAEGCVHATLGYYRAATFRTPAFLRAPITVPTLNVAGLDDPSVAPAVYEETRPHYRDRFEIASIAGGHFCHRESPRALLDAVIPFLK